MPLALAGTAAVMYVAGFSLDNLSLMALTVAIGFVVDDAIVVLENIYRYVEGGVPVREAALKGAGEIGFTVIAISVSLVAVFIPLLLMGGIVGRLLREFALTVSITIALSVVVSLTLTPMLCSRFLRDTTHDEHGKFHQLCERGFDWLLDRYAAGLQFVLRHQFVTLLSFFATLGLTVFLFIAIPKGFFPQQDTGFLFGQAVGPEDSSSAQMAGRMTALGRSSRVTRTSAAWRSTSARRRSTRAISTSTCARKRMGGRRRRMRSSRGCGPRRRRCRA